MCFSAEASFGLGAALLPASAYCVRQALVHAGRGYLPLALIPGLFGIQQLCEGFIWIGLGVDKAGLVQPFALAFLFFALGFWPFWIPLCATCVEGRPRSRLALGLLTLLSLGWLVGLYGPVLVEPDRYLSVQVVHHSIQYDYAQAPLPQMVPRVLLRGLYFGTVALPMILTSGQSPMLRWFGLLFAGSALVSHLIFSYAFASVWCFFAAALSFYLCVAFRSAGDLEVEKKVVQETS
jgi:hypothetical protein